MPTVSAQFKTYHDFASASLNDIYGDRLSSALMLEVNTPESGIFVNDGKAHFTFKPLPSSLSDFTFQKLIFIQDPSKASWRITYFDGDSNASDPVKLILEGIRWILSTIWEDSTPLPTFSCS